jgi:GAF domain
MSMPGHPARDYPRLFGAMNELLNILSAGGDEADALERSFQDAAEGFGAQKAVLLGVEAEHPLGLRSISSSGLSPRQIEACERGESVRGVSSSIIRASIRERRPQLIENPLFQPDQERTPALAGENYSVLCSPVLDPLRDVVLAVMYFQNDGLDESHAYRESDAVWLEGYASALGRAFGLFSRSAAASVS